MSVIIKFEVQIYFLCFNSDWRQQLNLCFLFIYSSLNHSPTRNIEGIHRVQNNQCPLHDDERSMKKTERQGNFFDYLQKCKRRISMRWFICLNIMRHDYLQKENILVTAYNKFKPHYMFQRQADKQVVRDEKVSVNIHYKVF